MRRFIQFIVVAAVLLIGGGASAKENVLIIGGAGNSGSMIAKILMSQGHDVTAFVRPSTDRALLAGTNAKFVVGDAMKAEEVAKALAGQKYTVMIEVVQILTIDDTQSYERMYKNFVPIAKKMGVKQFIGLSSGCGDREAKDCPLSPPLYKVAADQTKAEHVLRASGVPYTIIRVGALVPGNHNDPMAKLATGTSYLTEDLSVFGGAVRAELDEQFAACVGQQRCINKIFVLDDPTMKPQRDHWLCKRANEGNTIMRDVPACGPTPPLVGGRPRKEY
jgi:uncharacterized protein YbjT (DUF2867 family)